MDFINPKTVIDVGCGVGTWLSVFRDKGVEILGMDGNYVDPNLLLIDRENFVPTDLQYSIMLDKKFDLAITLEVAEHLTADRAAAFVEDLTKLSNVVVFSAAIPAQGGVNHVNERWLSYWVNLFTVNGYIAVDFVRPQIWQNNEVEFWYRQNMLLFCKKESILDYQKLIKYYKPIRNYQYWDIIHPEMYTCQVGRLVNAQQYIMRIRSEYRRITGNDFQ